MNILNPSILALDFNNMGRDLKIVRDSGAKYIHIDVMDGVFVSNISFGPPIVSFVKKAVPDFFMDVHLMTINPERYVEQWKKCGADSVTFHFEAVEDKNAVIEAIHAAGMKCGISINPGTPVQALAPFFDKVDMILVMSVEPGYGGQSFIEHSLDKLKEVRAELNRRGLNIDVEVDGGVTLDNVQAVVEAGANIIVAGSAVFKGDVAANVKGFLEKLN